MTKQVSETHEYKCIYFAKLYFALSCCLGLIFVWFYTL